MNKKIQENPIRISYAELEALGLKKNSDAIRFLNGQGYKTADIAKYLRIKYQHVRNVLLTEPKRKNTLDTVKNASEQINKNPLVFGSAFGISLDEEEVEKISGYKFG